MNLSPTIIERAANALHPHVWGYYEIAEMALEAALTPPEADAPIDLAELDQALQEEEVGLWVDELPPATISQTTIRMRKALIVAATNYRALFAPAKEGV